MRVCKKCGAEKPLTDYRKTGKWTGWSCKTCRNADRNRWEEQNVPDPTARRKEIKKATRESAVKSLGGVCARCGEKDFRVLEIDHINDDGKADRHKQNSGLYHEIIRGERADLQLLCGNCHNLKSWHRDVFDASKPKARSKFDIDLSYGKDRENAFIELVSGTIEVKSDRQAVNTGNVFVEYESRGKPGGVASTEAAVWAQEVEPDVWVVMRVDRMKQLVYRRLDRYGYVLGGDGKTSKGVLLRRAELTAPIIEEESE